MQIRTRHRRVRVASAAIFVALALASPPALATGPQQQTVPWWAPTTHPFNSVVRIQSSAGIGTGTIINTEVVNGQGWLAVLTADHVVRGVRDQRIMFGDLGTPPPGPVQQVVGSAAGPNRSWYISRSPDGSQPGQPNQQRREDLAVLAVHYGAPDFFFNNLTQHTFATHVPTPALDPTAPPAHGTTQPLGPAATAFTHVGYGRTGSFGTNAAGTLNGMNGGGPGDGLKRFQNNQGDRFLMINEGPAGDYLYWALQWDFNEPAAAGIFAGEGLSFAGDSGGPYFAQSLHGTWVDGMTRPGAADWGGGNGGPGGLMDLYATHITAIHSLGNASAPGFNPYTEYDANGNPIAGRHSFGAGVPLTQDLVNWINMTKVRVPTPGTATLLLLGTVFSIRRRR